MPIFSLKKCFFTGSLKKFYSNRKKICRFETNQYNMKFDIDKQSNYSIISSKEEKLNAINAPELKSIFVQLNKENVNTMILDLKATNYCDSSGLSSILTANRLCKDTNGKFILCNLQPNVLKMIQIAQLDRVLTIEESLTDAVGLLK